MNRIGAVSVLLLVTRLAAAQEQVLQSAPSSMVTLPPPVSYCPGEYADDVSVLLPKSRELEQHLPAYTFCVRTSATYECPSYAQDGSLRRKKRRVVAHGTAFAYRQQNGETLLVTNQHVAEWPAVTDEEHPAEDVPAGCKRVSDSVKIVDNDSDSFEPDDIALSRVVTDPQLDIAVLKAKVQLPVLPWKLGHSAGLKERNVVDVRGFPLGVFKATNEGKVVSAYDHDGYKDWEHDDFVIDALLPSGNSGSPVFAVSCKTGEFELVGVYHAGYTRGSALNVVVGVDQLRELMTTLKRVPRTRPEVTGILDLPARTQVMAAARSTLEPYFPFGQLTAAVRATDEGVLLYEVLGREFPLRAFPVLVLEDLAPIEAGTFGTTGRVWAGNRQGLKSYRRAELDADAQAQVARLIDGLRRGSVASTELRAADEGAATSRETFEKTERLERAIRKASAGNSDLAQSALDLAERLGPQPGEDAATMSTLMLPSRSTSAGPAALTASPIAPPPVDGAPVAPLADR
jgi:serine protease Do